MPNDPFWIEQDRLACLFCHAFRARFLSSTRRFNITSPSASNSRAGARSGLAEVTRAIQAERLAALEQRLTDHESRCEERLGEIKASAATTLKAVEGLKSRFWAIVLSLLAWALAQVWATSQAQIARLEARPAAIQEVADAAAR